MSPIFSKPNANTDLNLRGEIFSLARKYFEQSFVEQEFVAGVSPIPVSGKVLDADDLCSLLDASLDLWLTTGRFAVDFERSFAQFWGSRFALLCNSGSSANLLALAALTSKKLGDERLVPGDEIITAATGFPTTVNPALQYGLKPVFVDIDIPTYNIDCSLLEQALSDRTRAIMVAHTLGNPFDLGAVRAFADKHDLWLIEDCCDALGARYAEQPVGTFGELATVSFYPAHHITMGEGGCVMMSDGRLKQLVESFRDWGRDCWCDPGCDNTCGKRFDWCLGELPAGYDHKYIYSHVGYNLKLTDMQAAIGLSQLKKAPQFIAARRSNFLHLSAGLRDLEEHIILPQATKNSEPSWFGFPISLRADSKYQRRDLIAFLESNKIGTRLLFGGNLTKQPAFMGESFGVVGDLKNADLTMTNTFWIGVYPGLSEQMLDYVIEKFHEFFQTTKQ